MASRHELTVIMGRCKNALEACRRIEAEARRGVIVATQQREEAQNRYEDACEKLALDVLGETGTVATVPE